MRSREEERASLYRVELDKNEVFKILTEHASKHVTTKWPTVNYKPVFISTDSYGGFVLTFIKLSEKEFKVVEPLDF